mmetsp:Transcript_40329/g.64790  ORF Transcript_40329/g.64790 Transcript_40329/m.64790 type:complete len:160 (-) Transcript_40329:485-964(-)
MQRNSEETSTSCATAISRLAGCKDTHVLTVTDTGIPYFEKSQLLPKTTTTTPTTTTTTTITTCSNMKRAKGTTTPPITSTHTTQGSELGFNFELFAHCTSFFGEKVVLLGNFNGEVVGRVISVTAARARAHALTCSFDILHSTMQSVCVFKGNTMAQRG